MLQHNTKCRSLESEISSGVDLLFIKMMYPNQIYCQNYFTFYCFLIFMHTIFVTLFISNWYWNISDSTYMYIMQESFLHLHSR